MLFANFLRRNLAFFKLAVLSNLEYRLNFFVDAIAQPLITSLIELTVWFALFKGNELTQINGFKLEAYLAYAIWGAFMARITSTWMYEFRMIEEIDSGSINSLLTRPLSFFEYYMSQFMGYKITTTLISFIVPIATCYFFDFQVVWSRLLPALLLVFYYLFLVQTLSFIFASFSFFLNRSTSLTVAKNLGIWLLSGELVPLDLLPENITKFLLLLPFSNAVYVPVGYLTGRVSQEVFFYGFVNTTLGLVILGLVARLIWRQGLSQYSGTGA